MSHRILVATADTVDVKRAGPAIRAAEISRALSREHDVHLVSTGTCSLPDAPFRTSSVDDAALERAVTWADIVIFQGWVNANRPFVTANSKVLIIDLYDPMHLEVLEQARQDDVDAWWGSFNSAKAVITEQLRRGDWFMCASDRQRALWLGELAAEGRINPTTYAEDVGLQSLIDVVPFGVADEAPTRTGPGLKGATPGIGPEDRVLLWGGGIYDWFDPLTLIRAVDRLRHQHDDVRLVFMGTKHPSPLVPEMDMAGQARALAHDLDLTGRWVFFNEGWVPYDERQNFLLDADICVTSHFATLETEFAFRTRMLDYLWVGRPIVTSGGDALADLVDRAHLGIAVEPGDVDALEQALGKLLSDDGFAASCADNIESLRPQFTWSEVLTPLLDFCRSPRRAPDLVDPLIGRRRFLGVPRPPGRAGVAWDARRARALWDEGGVRLMAQRVRRRLRRAR
jgi:glycosyltransferase involved in cell wall biosynthesis